MKSKEALLESIVEFNKAILEGKRGEERKRIMHQKCNEACLEKLHAGGFDNTPNRFEAYLQCLDTCTIQWR